MSLLSFLKYVPRSVPLTVQIFKHESNRLHNIDIHGFHPLANYYVGARKDSPTVPVIVSGYEDVVCTAAVMINSPGTLELFRTFLALVDIHVLDNVYMYAQLRLKMNGTFHMIKVTPNDAYMLGHPEHELLAFVIVQLSDEMEDVKRSLARG